MSLMKSTDEPICTSACSTVPPGPRCRVPRSAAPKTFLYQSIACAAPSTTSDGVTACRPSGMYLFALAMVSNLHPSKRATRTTAKGARPVKIRKAAAGEKSELILDEQSMRDGEHDGRGTSACKPRAQALRRRA